MMEQMAKMAGAVKKTAWGGGGQGSLSLVLKEDNYRTVKRDSSANINWILNPALVNKSITEFSMPFKTLNLQ